MDEAIVERLRDLCLDLPGVTERLSHGEPTWFAGKRTFVNLSSHHHDDREAFWCAAPPGAQEALTEADPERFFRPPYVGHRGWLGVYLDVAQDWDEVVDLVEDAYRMVATKRLLAELDAQRAQGRDPHSDLRAKPEALDGPRGAGARLSRSLPRSPRRGR